MLKHTIKITLKILWRRRFFTFVSLFGISVSLTILIVAAAFYEYAFGITPWDPVTDQLLYINRLHFENDYSVINSRPSFQFLNQYLNKLQTPKAISLFSKKNDTSIFKDKIKTNVILKYTDHIFWEIFNFRLVEGTYFGAFALKNEEKVAVISQHLKSKLLGSGSALGKRIKINEYEFVVIGVVEDVSEYYNNTYAEIWLPHTTRIHKFTDHPFQGDFSAVVLADSAEDIEKIRLEFRKILKEVDFPPGNVRNVIAVPLHTKKSEALSRLFDEHTDVLDESVFYALVLGGILLFMILPVINLMNLNISRIAERSSEIGVRKAFGANNWHLMGQFLFENIILTAIAGPVAYLAAFFTLRLISHSGIAYFVDFSINMKVFVMGMALTFIFGALSGVYPAYRMAKQNPIESLSRRTT
jgi:putative ABC transport system permease protein